MTNLNKMRNETERLVKKAIIRGEGIMNSDEKACISQFEIVGEEQVQVRLNMVRGVYGVNGYGVAVE